MLKKAITLLVVCWLLIGPAGVTVYGQSCEQGGFPLVGPHSAYSYNIVWDPTFDQTSCPIWEFGFAAERALTGTMCSGWSPPFARFNGPSYGWTWIEQDTNALSDPEWRYFRFRYTVEIDDPLNNPNTRLEVWFYINGVWTFVDEVAGSHWCETRFVNLNWEDRSNWVGQPITVLFWAALPGSSKISIAETALWQSQYND